MCAQCSQNSLTCEFDVYSSRSCACSACTAAKGKCLDGVAPDKETPPKPKAAAAPVASGSQPAAQAPARTPVKPRPRNSGTGVAGPSTASVSNTPTKTAEKAKKEAEEKSKREAEEKAKREAAEKEARRKAKGKGRAEPEPEPEVEAEAEAEVEAERREEEEDRPRTARGRREVKMMGLLRCTFLEMRSLRNDLEVVRAEVAGLRRQLGDDRSFRDGVIREYMAALVDGDEDSGSEEEMKDDPEYQPEAEPGADVEMVSE